MAHVPIDPIRKQLDTPASPDQAYTIFTDKAAETYEGYDSGWDHVFVKRFGIMLAQSIPRPIGGLS